MSVGMSIDEIRAVCLEAGNLIRATASWGLDKATGTSTELSEQMVHHFLGALLQAVIGREPIAAEIAWVWEV